MRQNFLSHPRFQLFFTLSFVLGAVFIVTSLGVISWATINHLATTLPINDYQRALIHDGANQLLFMLMIAVLVTCIGFTAAGLYLSARFIGPLTRLEAWLENYLRGQSFQPLRLRKGDELNGIAKLLFKILEKVERKA